jgi:type I restriction enzyme M protein
LKDNGKMAVVLDTGAVSRGSGNQGSNKERDIRRKVVDADFVECVILLPENLFYNTTAPGIILVINKAKTHQGEILLIVEGLSKIIPLEDAVRNDYNLSPSRYVASNDKEEYLPIDEVLVELSEVEEERRAIDGQLNEILLSLGFEGY